MTERKTESSDGEKPALWSKVKETLAFWLQILCTLVLVKLVGVVGAIVSYASYYLLKEKIGIFGGLICSVILGAIVGIGITALMIAG